MVDTPGWERKHIYPLTGGYNDSAPADAIPDGDSPNLKNVRFDRGKVIVDYGYSAWGSTVRGSPRMAYQFNRKDSTTELLLLTNETLYRWKSGEWQYIQDTDAGTLVNGAQAAGETVIEVDAVTEFTVGDYVGVVLDNGTEHKTTIAAIDAVALTITIDDAVPSGRTIPDNAAFIKATELNGTVVDLPSMATWPADDCVILTNYQDNVKRYDGTDCRDVPNLPSSGSCRARIVRVKDNHVILLNTVEGGTQYPQRVRYCDAGDYTNWSTGVAGFEDLYDTSDQIVAAERLGPYLIIYRESTVSRMEYVGSSTHLFWFTTTVTDNGAMSQASVVDRGSYHVVLGSSSFYIYDGGYGTSPFGEKIWNRLFGPNRVLNDAYKHRVVSIYIDSLDSYWWLVPTGESTFPSELVRYNATTKGWSIREFADKMLNVCVYMLTNYQPWNTAVGTWTGGSWTRAWLDVTVDVGTFRVGLCGESPKQAYEYASEYADDNGTAISYTYDTGDYLYPDAKIRFDMLSARCKGSSITVSYSTDMGDTWTVIDTISPGSEYTRQDVHKQIVADRIRFRFSGSSTFGLEWIALKIRKESEW